MLVGPRMPRDPVRESCDRAMPEGADATVILTETHPGPDRHRLPDSSGVRHTGELRSVATWSGSRRERVSSSTSA